MEYESFIQLGEFGDHEDPLEKILFFPSGKRFLSLSEGYLAIWNPLERRKEDEWHFDGEIQEVLILPDGNKLICSLEDQGVHIIDLETKRSLYQFPESVGEIRAMALAPEKQLLAWILDNELWIWNLNTLQRERRRKFSSQELLSLSWSIKEDSYAIGDEDGYLVLWDLDTSKKIWETYLQGYPCWNLAFHESNEFLAVTVGANVQLRYRGNGASMGELCGHEGEVRQCQMDPLGLFVLTGSYGREGDDSIRIFRIATYTSVRTLECEDLSCFCLSPKGDLLIAGTKEGILKVFGLLK